MEKVEKEQWIELYKKLDEIYEFCPWEYYKSKDTIAIIDDDTNKMYYCIVLGESKKLPGFLIISEDDILKFRKTLVEDYPMVQILNYQNGFMVSYPTADKLTEVDRIIPKQVGISFKDICIKIDSYSIGYLPTVLTYEQCVLFNRLVSSFLPIFKLIYHEKITLPNDSNKMVVRYYDNDIKQHTTKILPLVLPQEPAYKSMKLTIIHPKKTNQALEIEVYKHFPMAIGEFYEDLRYRLPYYIAYADIQTGKIIQFKLMRETGELYDKILQKELKELFMNYGLPQKIMVRDEKEAALFSQLGNRYGIQIEISPKLKVIDSFITGLIQENKS